MPPQRYAQPEQIRPRLTVYMDKFDTVKGFRTCTAALFTVTAVVPLVSPSTTNLWLLSHRHSVPYSLLVDRYYRVVPLHH